MRQFPKPVSGRGRRGIHQWTQDRKEGGETGTQAAATSGAGGSLPLRLEAAVRASLPWPGLVIVFSNVTEPSILGRAVLLKGNQKERPVHKSSQLEPQASTLHSAGGPERSGRMSTPISLGSSPCPSVLPRGLGYLDARAGSFPTLDLALSRRRPLPAFLTF